jgi:hypothetical protein
MQLPNILRDTNRVVVNARALMHRLSAEYALSWEKENGESFETFLRHEYREEEFDLVISILRLDGYC